MVQTKKYFRDRRNRYIEEGRCIDCGEEVKIPFKDHPFFKGLKERNIRGHYCDRCLRLRKQRYNDRAGKFKCIDCGKSLKTYNVERCQKCYFKSKRI